MAAGINIGELDRRIAIYTMTETYSDTGEPTRTPVLLKTCFAKVEYSGGTEVIASEKPTAKRDLIFTIRYIPTIDETCRIVYKDTNYNINYIEEVERKVWHRLTASMPDNQ